MNGETPSPFTTASIATVTPPQADNSPPYLVISIGVGSCVIILIIVILLICVGMRCRKSARSTGKKGMKEDKPTPSEENIATNSTYMGNAFNNLDRLSKRKRDSQNDYELYRISQGPMQRHLLGTEGASNCSATDEKLSCVEEEEAGAVGTAYACLNEFEISPYDALGHGPSSPITKDEAGYDKIRKFSAAVITVDQCGKTTLTSVGKESVNKTLADKTSMGPCHAINQPKGKIPCDLAIGVQTKQAHLKNSDLIKVVENPKEDPYDLAEDEERKEYLYDIAADVEKSRLNPYDYASAGKSGDEYDKLAGTHTPLSLTVKDAAGYDHISRIGGKISIVKPPKDISSIGNEETYEFLEEVNLIDEGNTSQATSKKELLESSDLQNSDTDYHNSTKVMKNAQIKQKNINSKLKPGKVIVVENDLYERSTKEGIAKIDVQGKDLVQIDKDKTYMNQEVIEMDDFNRNGNSNSEMKPKVIVVENDLYARGTNGTASNGDKQYKDPRQEKNDKTYTNQEVIRDKSGHKNDASDSKMKQTNVIVVENDLYQKGAETFQHKEMNSGDQGAGSPKNVIIKENSLYMKGPQEKPNIIVVENDLYNQDKLERKINVEGV